MAGQIAGLMAGLMAVLGAVLMDAMKLDARSHDDWSIS
jgi:hypothetical protein